MPFDMTPLLRAHPKVSRFVAASSGATAVEFALLAIPFFGLLMMIIQVGLLHFGVQSLDYATREAGRRIMTGQVPTTITSANQFRDQLICPRMFFAIDCMKVVITATRVSKASDAQKMTGIYAFVDPGTKTIKPPETDPAKASFCLGGQGDYILLDVSAPITNFVGRLLGAYVGPTYDMRSMSFVFNEPYKSSSASGTC